MLPRHLLFLLAGIFLLTTALTGCGPAEDPQVGGVTAIAPSDTSHPVDYEPARLQPTWTATPQPPAPVPSPSHTPSPTFDLPKTMVAQTTVAAGVHCQRHPDAWQIYSGPAAAYAGWCMVVGAWDTLYEYRVLSPDGWVSNTFGELTPNLAFSVGKNNVNVRLYQAFSYENRNYEGTLAEAPEKAFVCNDDDRCFGFLDPHETLVREEIKAYAGRDILILDSRIDSTSGNMLIRRYYQILPFRVHGHMSQRLFILEYSGLESAMDAQEFDDMLEKLEVMALSIGQR